MGLDVFQTVQTVDIGLGACGDDIRVRALAQDEASSVVFGMPMEAWKNGAAERLVTLESIADEISVIGRQLQGTGAR